MRARTSQNYFHQAVLREFARNTKQDSETKHTPCSDMASFWPTNLGLTGDSVTQTGGQWYGHTEGLAACSY